MADRSRYDAIVAGAGIAGLSLAWSLNRSGLRVAVIDRASPGSGASGTPGALLNPATGRRARKSWHAETCLPFSRDLIQRVEQATGQPLLRLNGVVRPALDDKIAARMQETWREDDWPEGWTEWLSPQEMSRRFPGLFSRFGGLWVPVGGSIDMARLMKALYLFLKEEGVTFYLGSSVRITSDGESWRAGSSQYDLQAPILIEATGSSMVFSEHWSQLPLHRVKGQVITVQLRESPQLPCSVSSLGYIARSPESDRTLILGSTYEHDFTHEELDRSGRDYLLKRLERTLPGIGDQVQSVSGWAGIRLTTPDKNPFIGPHPQLRGLYGFGGLGSKGLMLGPYLGRMLAGAIVDEDEIAEPFRIERLYDPESGEHCPQNK